MNQADSIMRMYISARIVTNGNGREGRFAANLLFIGAMGFWSLTIVHVDTLKFFETIF